MKVSVNNMYKLNVYTCKYLNEKYGYSFNNNEIIAMSLHYYMNVLKYSIEN